VWTGGDALAWSETQARQICAAEGLQLAELEETGEGAATHADTAGSTYAAGKPIATMREMHENRELERIFERLSQVGLSIEDYALVQEESVTGEKLATKYAWELTDSGRAEAVKKASEAEQAAQTPVATEEVEKAIVAGALDSGDDAVGEEETAAPPEAQTGAGRAVEAANIPSILRTLQEVGRRGIEIKRFKGLGEMDAEQLWETTMDPARRTLLRVSWDGAAEADNLFSILMGEGVEERRSFIEEHALEVKNLDV
jgi:DNA gyrase subunit B